MKIDIQIEGSENYRVGRQVERVVVKDTALITGDLNIHGSGMFP